MSITLDGLQHSLNQQSFKIETIENKIRAFEKDSSKIVSLKECLVNQELHSEHLYKTLDNYEIHTKDNTKSLNAMGKYIQEVDAKVEKLTSKVEVFVLPTLEKLAKDQNKTNDLLMKIAEKLGV